MDSEDLNSLYEAVRDSAGFTLSGSRLTTHGHGKKRVIVALDSASPDIEVTKKAARNAKAGGQAVVVKCRMAGEQRALRLTMGSWQDWRLAGMIHAGELAKDPDRYPALIRVDESFEAELPQWLGSASGAIVICQVMEWGEPLSVLAGRIDRTEANTRFLQVLRTMRNLNTDEHWVHRDLDEGNVLVATDRSWRIADLGVATVATDGTITVIQGKPTAQSSSQCI